MNTGKRINSRMCLGLASLLIWASCPGVQLQAQTIFANPQNRNGEVQAAALTGGGGADHTITLTKMVEIYEFEGLKVAVDQYKINRGDSLVKVLQSRGLIKSSADQARMLRLVKDLNPDLKSVNSLMPGQIINVPSLLTPQQIEAAERIASGQSEAETPASVSPPATSVIETFVEKEYQRPASSQQSALVRILRNRPTSVAGDELVLAQNTLRPAESTAADASTLTAAVPNNQAAQDVPALSQTIVSPPVITLGEVPVPSPAAGAGVSSSTPAQANSQNRPASPPAQVGTAPAAAPPMTSAAPSAVINYASGNTGDLNVEAGSGVVYRTIKVRKGDTLERLLRREGMHRDLIYAHLLKVTMQLNPDIKNPDLIIAGAEIRIPAAGDYLSAMAGVDPAEVRNAATAVAERRRPRGGGAGGGVLRASAGGQLETTSKTAPKAAVAALPDETTESAKQTLALLFTRLGERVDSRGQAVLRGDDGSGVELNTSDFPVVQLNSGVRLVLDPGSRLSQATIKNLRSLSPPMQVFKTGKKESLDRALERLWALCGFYRVFNHERTYEGGGDIKLRISADWMVWPTEEAWAAGQPLVVNRLRNENQRTDAAWAGFLEDHGIKLVDIYKNLIVPPAEAPPAKPALSVVSLNNSNPSLLAAELVKHLGIDDPKVGVQLDMVQKPGEPAPANMTAPVLWETDKAKVVLEFGELPQDAVQTLRQRGYKVVSAQKDSDSVIKAVLEGYGLKAQDGLTISAPAGGPKMSLVIKGRVVSAAGRSFLITQTALPAGLSNLVDPGLTVLRY